MLTHITEKRLVEQEVTVAGICTCDICDKVIYNIVDAKKDPHNEYWHLVTGHHDWGNDSIDSIEAMDLCSKECCRKALEQYLEDYSGIHNTAYFELEHKNKYP